MTKPEQYRLNILAMDKQSELLHDMAEFTKNIQQNHAQGTIMEGLANVLKSQATLAEIMLDVWKSQNRTP